MDWQAFGYKPVALTSRLATFHRTTLNNTMHSIYRAQSPSLPAFKIIWKNWNFIPSILATDVLFNIGIKLRRKSSTSSDEVRGQGGGCMNSIYMLTLKGAHGGLWPWRPKFRKRWDGRRSDRRRLEERRWDGSSQACAGMALCTLGAFTAMSFNVAEKTA